MHKLLRWHITTAYHTNYMERRLWHAQVLFPMVMTENEIGVVTDFQAQTGVHPHMQQQVLTSHLDVAMAVHSPKM
jgi:hypothetical protein